MPSQAIPGSCLDCGRAKSCCQPAASVLLLDMLSFPCTSLHTSHLLRAVTNKLQRKGVLQRKKWSHFRALLLFLNSARTALKCDHALRCKTPLRCNLVVTCAGQPHQRVREADRFVCVAILSSGAACVHFGSWFDSGSHVFSRPMMERS